MSSQLPPTVAELVRIQMASGQYSSEEALLVEALQALAERDEEVLAIAAALKSMEEGDEGVPLAEAFDRLRQKYQIRDGE